MYFNFMKNLEQNEKEKRMKVLKPFTKTIGLLFKPTIS